MYLNKAIIVGNLTRDPELKAMPNGNSVANFSIATNRTWRDKDGKQQVSVAYHNIIVFGKQAHSCAGYLKKGQSVLVEGRLQTRSWDSKEGVKQYRTEIVADRVQFGPQSARTNPDGARDDTDGIDDVSTPKRPISQNKGNRKVVTPSGIEYPEEEIKPEDIPF